LSDEEIIRLYETSKQELADTRYNTRVRRIGKDVVVKCPAQKHELTALELVQTQTTIPVPRPYRYIQTDPQKDGYLVLPYLQGRSIESSWTGLNIWRKFSIAWTLRGYVRQLRRVRHALPDGSEQQWPGPVSSVPARCEHELFFSTIGSDPFHNQSQLHDWYDHKLEVSKKWKKAPENALQYDRSLPLVFTHLDISPQNLILDDQNRLWLIDFGFSGYFDKSFEYLGMRIGWDSFGRWTSRILAWFVTGYYGRHWEFLRNIGWALNVGYLM